MTREIPLVSIICTNFNKGDWIRDALESFLKQKADFTYEILIIDDASTDNSPAIIRQYAERYPDLVHAFFNKKNLGITKTWVKVCKQAKGKYIARCDGDDYWIDDRKLQKQVDLLKESKNSKWCSTDYNIISPEGGLLHTSAFENGLVDRADSYARMLVTKGFTMSSTWLVDTRLMQEINSEIDTNAIDDTFNLQLDLFRKTKLTYLPEATVVYRINEGSDSRPTDMEKIRVRNERLLKTQLEYIEKYKDVDYEEMLKLLLPRDMQMELWSIERLHIIQQKERHIKQQEQFIKSLEKRLKTITESKMYRLMVACRNLVISCKNIPVTFIKKIKPNARPERIKE